MQEFEHTSRDDRTYTEEELACPYFDECYIQVRNQGHADIIVRIIHTQIRRSQNETDERNS